MPLPGTVVIGPGWSAHHRPVVTGTMTATCSLRRPGGTSGSFNSTTGTNTVTPHTAYLTGAKCRVQALSVGEQGQERATGEQQVTTMPYLIAVDWTTAAAVEPRVGDIVKLTAVDGNGDPTLINREFTVEAVVRSSLEWERDLTCTDNLG